MPLPLSRRQRAAVGAEHESLYPILVATGQRPALPRLEIEDADGKSRRWLNLWSSK